MSSRSWLLARADLRVHAESLKPRRAADDTNGGMSRFLALVTCCALFAASSASASKIADPGKTRGATGPAPTVSWAQTHIRYVVAHGLMAKTVAAFRAGDDLTQGELASLVSGLTKQPATVPANPAAPVTVTQLDAKLVRTLAALRCGCRFRRRGEGRGSGGAVSVRHRERRAPARPSYRPSRQAGRSRAPAQRPDHARGDRLLGLEDPPLRRLGARLRRDLGRDVRASAAQCLAEARAQHGRQA